MGVSQDFYFLDSVKFVSVIGRIKVFDHDHFLGGLKTKFLNIDTFLTDLWKLTNSFTKIKHNKKDITKSELIWHFQGKQEYCLSFEDILCTLHSVLEIMKVSFSLKNMSYPFTRSKPESGESVRNVSLFKMFIFTQINFYHDSNPKILSKI